MGNCASSPENVIIPNEISEKYSQRLLDTNDEIGLLFERTRCGDKNSFEDILQYSREKNFLAQVFLIPIYYYTKGAIKSNAKLAVEIADKHIVKLKEMVPNTKNKYKYLNFILGYCYDMGLGVPKDNSKAIRLYSLAAAQGYAPAQKFLGSCYYVGDGVEKDLGEAVFWYRLAAEQQYADAQYALGFCYQHGVGVKGVDLSQAFYLYECAALQGHQDAEDVLNKDFSKLFEKVILVYSDIYYDEELESLGLLTNKKNRSHRNKSDSFDFDIVIERCSSDDDSSEELKISESITIDFQLNSGQSESNPHKKYDNKIVSSVSKAFEELVKHAEKGHKLAMAFLIVLYYYGINGQYKDTNKAHNIARSLLDYLKLYSDEKNNCYTQCILGFCYDKGVGIAANPYEAFRLYELSAKLGDYSVAQCILGNKMLRMHVMDDGNTDDCEDSGERSMKWYKMAAENDNPIGQFEMGKYFENYYLNYCSIKSRRRSSCQMKNTSAAIDWYIKAADNGHIEAQRRLESLKCF